MDCGPDRVHALWTTCGRRGPRLLWTGAVACADLVHRLWTAESCGRCLRCGQCDRHPDGSRSAAASSGTRTTGRSSGSPCRRSARWSPSRCSCSPTRRSSATWAPRSWPALGDRRGGCWPPPSRCASSWPTAPPPRWPAGSAPATCVPPCARASTASGWRSASACVLAVAGLLAAEPLVARLRPVRRPRPHARDLPAGLPPRPAGDARRARRHRRAARAAGHPHPARRRRGRRGRQRRAQPRPGLRRSAWASPGSALGTVLAQLGMAAAFVVVVVRGARRHDAPLRPDLPGIRAAAQRRRPAGGPHRDAARRAAR